MGGDRVSCVYRFDPEFRKDRLWTHGEAYSIHYFDRGATHIFADSFIKSQSRLGGACLWDHWTRGRLRVFSRGTCDCHVPCRICLLRGWRKSEPDTIDLRKRERVWNGKICDETDRVVSKGWGERA